MAACAMSLPAVPGLSAAESCRGSWIGPHDAEVWVLVRRESLTRFERLAPTAHPWGDRAKALVGDLTADESRPHRRDRRRAGRRRPRGALRRHLRHHRRRGRQRAANVEGTRAVIALARRLDATLHHVSSIAVAGTYRGEYTEDDFDVAQDLPTPYHQTKFEAELLVRSAPGLRYRIYRPAVVVGDSRTGEMDKVDGPYYFFGMLAKLAVLPTFTPMVLPDTGRTNIVPVDYVVDALDRTDARRRSRRPDVPPHRARKPSGCAASTAASPRRQACRRCAGRCPVRPRHRSSGRPGAPRCCATWRPRNWACPPRSSTSST